MSMLNEKEMSFELIEISNNPTPPGELEPDGEQWVLRTDQEGHEHAERVGDVVRTYWDK